MRHLLRNPHDWLGSLSFVLGLDVASDFAEADHPVPVVIGLAAQRLCKGVGEFPVGKLLGTAGGNNSDIRQVQWFPEKCAGIAGIKDQQDITPELGQFPAQVIGSQHPLASCRCHPKAMLACRAVHIEKDDRKRVLSRSLLQPADSVQDVISGRLWTQQRVRPESALVVFRPCPADVLGVMVEQVDAHGQRALLGKPGKLGRLAPGFL